jgi:hypothetical protein
VCVLERAMRGGGARQTPECIPARANRAEVNPEYWLAPTRSGDTASHRHGD